jgi:hypothetical protein
MNGRATPEELARLVAERIVIDYDILTSIDLGAKTLKRQRKRTEPIKIATFEAWHAAHAPCEKVATLEKQSRLGRTRPTPGRSVSLQRSVKRTIPPKAVPHG